MNRIVTVGILVFFLLAGALAQPPQESVKLDVLSKKRGESASLTHDLMEFKIKITNQARKPLPFTNNRFVLTDDQGEHYLVSRGWYPQGKQLKPGESAEIDRVFFEIPKKRKAASITLMFRRIPLGTAKL